MRHICEFTINEKQNKNSKGKMRILIILETRISIRILNNSFFKKL